MEVPFVLEWVTGEGIVPGCLPQPELGKWHTAYVVRSYCALRDIPECFATLDGNSGESGGVGRAGPAAGWDRRPSSGKSSAQAILPGKGD